MDTHQQQWKIILTRLLLADDFQALQFFKLADARIRQYNITLDEVCARGSLPLSLCF